MYNVSDARVQFLRRRCTARATRRVQRKRHIQLSKRGIDKKSSQQKLADKIKAVISDDDFDVEEVIRAVDNVLIHKRMDRLTLTVDGMNELLALLCDIKNNTRSWENYGHTPNEMIEMNWEHQ